MNKIINKFIHWICEKFDIAEEDNLIIDFQKETNTFIDPEKQIKHEEREKNGIWKDNLNGITIKVI